LAATGSDALAILFRPTQAAKNHAPATLRLQMLEHRKIHILKQRGGHQDIEVALPPTEEIPTQNRTNRYTAPLMPRPVRGPCTKKPDHGLSVWMNG
ncbi:MAG: hypothetical protein V7746_23150, partial [Halioglobus sp.]